VKLDLSLAPSEGQRSRGLADETPEAQMAMVSKICLKEWEGDCRDAMRNLP